MKLYNGSLPMRVCCFMSGSGTNVKKIIEGERGYKVVVIFTDNPESNAQKIGNNYGIPVIVHNIKQFYQGKVVSAGRDAYDSKSLWYLRDHSFEVIALAGYNYVVSPTIINKYLTVNVHPADLSVTCDGKRCYKGLGSTPSAKAIRAGETSLCSTTHIARRNVDEGEILLRSPRVPVDPSKSAKWHQQQLKIHGDWIIYPLTLRWIAEGKFTTDGNVLYFNKTPIPDGYEVSRWLASGLWEAKVLA